MLNTSKTFQLKSAEILTVGTELLLGQILNTNAYSLARELKLLGLDSYYQTVVGDNHQRLCEAMRLAASRSDCVLVTGGLGPTQDDISMEAAATVCGSDLKMNPQAAEDIKNYFASQGRRMPPNNLKQAMLPENSLMLPNHNGTAPGAAMVYRREERECIFILLPGPPAENLPMFKSYVKPLLNHYADAVLDNIFIKTIGIGESAAAELLEDLLSAEHANPSLAPYASWGEVSFRLSYKHLRTQKNALQTKEVQEMLSEIKKRLGSLIYEIGERTLDEVTAALLLEQKKTAAFAESCTAGLAAAKLASYPGISAALKGGVVAYQNEIKQNVLEIPEEILKNEGAVSEACAAAMAENVRRIFASDYGISVTGNAGPDPSEGKEVGLVYIASAGPAGTQTEVCHFNGSRSKIRELAAKRALDLLRRSLLESAAS